MRVGLRLRGFLAVLGCSGCSVLLDGDPLVSGGENSSTGGAAVGQSGSAGTAAQAGLGGGTAGQGGSTSIAGQGPDCPVEAGDTCDGLDGDCKPTLEEPACPPDCDGILLNGTAYMACAAGAAFNDAEVLCQTQGMHLIRIDDAAENSVAVELAKQLGSYVWLGGSSLAEAGSYAWQDGAVFFRDGAAVEGVYQNFEPGQPVEGAGRNCIQLHDSVDGPWSNAPCSDVKPYVCERF